MPEPFSTPPGPIGLPLVGVLPQFLFNPAGFLMETFREYGDIAYFRMGMQKVYLLNRPDLVEEVLVTGQGNFTKSRILQRARTLLGEGLLTSEGEHHLRQRRLAQPAFYRGHLTSYARTMTECAERAASRWQDGQTLDIAQEMMRLTLAIVGLTLFGRDIEQDADDIGPALTDVLATFGTMLMPGASMMQMMPFGATARARRAQKVLDAKVAEMIRAAREAPAGRDDLLSLLLHATDAEGGMSDKQLRDEVLTLLLAGHETTATALTWTWYLISQHPDVEAKLRAEWQSLPEEPGNDDLPNMPYTEQVFAESLRLYPPAWALGRMARHQVRIYNFLVPKGGICALSPYVMHRHPRYWPKPERFDPDRFLPEEKAKRPKFAYFPFGGGPRVCIGERFAWMEAMLLLATIGRRWRMQMVPDHPVEVHPQITLRPRYGMKMKVERVVA